MTGRWIACLASVCAACTSSDSTCPASETLTGGRLACHVEHLLDDGGLSKSEVIDDATTLPALGEPGLAARGWSREPDDDHGGHLYSIGVAALYGNGQRAVFGAAGTLELLSFADGSQAAYVQVIELAADGTVQTNSIDVLDQM